MLLGRISISAMATPLLIHCSDCCIKQLDCNVSSHIKRACNACHVNGLECLSPPLTNLLHGPLTTQILARSQKKLELYRMFIPNPTYSRFDSNSCKTPTYMHRKRTQNRASKKTVAVCCHFLATSHITHKFIWLARARARARAILG